MKTERKWLFDYEGDVIAAYLEEKARQGYRLSSFMNSVFGMVFHFDEAEKTELKYSFQVLGRKAASKDSVFKTMCREAGWMLVYQNEFNAVFCNRDLDAEPIYSDDTGKHTEVMSSYKNYKKIFLSAFLVSFLSEMFRRGLLQSFYWFILAIILIQLIFYKIWDHRAKKAMQEGLSVQELPKKTRKLRNILLNSVIGLYFTAAPLIMLYHAYIGQYNKIAVLLVPIFTLLFMGIIERLIVRKQKTEESWIRTLGFFGAFIVAVVLAVVCVDPLIVTESESYTLTVTEEGEIIGNEEMPYFSSLDYGFRPTAEREFSVSTFTSVAEKMMLVHEHVEIPSDDIRNIMLSVEDFHYIIYLYQNEATARHNLAEMTEGMYLYEQGNSAFDAVYVDEEVYKKEEYRWYDEWTGEYITTTTHFDWRDTYILDGSHIYVVRISEEELAALYETLSARG